MQLTEHDLEAYVRLFSDEDVAERVEKLRAALAGGKRSLADIRINEARTAALRLADVGGGTVVLVGPLGDADAAADLVPDAMERARTLEARTISTRPRVGMFGEPYRAALLTQGFEERGVRIEFKTDVASLPMDDGTPLAWKGMDELGLESAADMLARAAAGDPHGLSKGEDPRATLAGYLKNPDLTSDPACVQVGFDGDAPVAFVCAQVDPADGWSRVTYMGIVPDARGRGLGTWVHRRGFRLMRDQGGKTYHGGTAAENAGMVRLFERHGCKEVARLAEFEKVL